MFLKKDKNINDNIISIEKIESIQQELNYIRQDLINTYYLNLEIYKNQLYLLKDLNLFKDKKSEIKLIAESERASDSSDCQYPEATLDGMIRNPSFTNRILELYGKEASLLDIGCGAGGIVFDALMGGITAFGIDGSDYNKKTGHGYWSIIKNNLFTCDATKKYYFEKEGKPYKFKVISSWECLEHIPEQIVPKFLNNVFLNLDSDGIFIGSISRLPYEKNGVIYHTTLQDETWWREKFREQGFIFETNNFSPFCIQDFCRGTGSGWQDLHTNYIKHPENGIIFVAKISTYNNSTPGIE